MTLRMVFDRDDLHRVRLADGPDPLWELVLSLHAAREPQVPAHLARWREQASIRVTAHDHARKWLGILFTLVPLEGNFPDFLTPAYSGDSIDAGSETIARTRRSLLRPDLEAVFTGRTPPQWVRELAAGDHRRLTDVAGAMHTGYDVLLEPVWHELTGTVGADRRTRTDALARGGVDALLGSIPGVIGWDGQVLEIGYGLRDHTVHLRGRGLTILPSYFCTERPITLIDPELPPVLVYPAADGIQSGPRTASAQLVALLGRTRAECLAALATTLTTSGLAARVGTSVGSASKHATVLREAGLITTVRHGGAVRHHVTELGAALLDER
ncbi:helix-turn-helix domain-containing protein [Kribbella soli]|uniref:Transcriptional regulator n=1 Tax=Kribbella soli TaxID=1124743 RepID=A0A4R0GXZ7_9ACTN|nr:helix-turn-helix domain-containing protein [Kribbella soli]TCC02975.1 transcriptional regulator [Kribbella soli]